MKFVSIVFILAFYIGNSIFSQTEQQKKISDSIRASLEYAKVFPSKTEFDELGCGAFVRF